MLINKPAYRCKVCHWITETTGKGLMCERCKALKPQRLTDAEMVAAIDAGEMTFCKPCQCFHLS